MKRRSDPQRHGAQAEIRRGLPMALRSEAAALFWLAFAPLLRPLGRARAGRAWLRGALRCDRVIAATDISGRLIGVAGLRDADGGVLRSGGGPMRRVWGARGGRLRMWLLRLWRAGETQALVIDGIAVAPEMRGAGIGGRLVEALAAEARAQGRTALQVEVAPGNRKVAAFYHGLGFRRVDAPPVGWPWAGRALVMRMPVGAEDHRTRETRRADQPNMPAARASKRNARAERV